MIWYDARTKQPVAPGSCEDAGVPSIDGYYCPSCDAKQPLRGVKIWSGGPELPGCWIDVCLCEVCGTLLLTGMLI